MPFETTSKSLDMIFGAFLHYRNTATYFEASHCCHFSQKDIKATAEKPSEVLCIALLLLLAFFRSDFFCSSAAVDTFVQNCLLSPFAGHCTNGEVPHFDLWCRLRRVILVKSSAHA